MKVRLVGRVPVMGGFVVSQLVELEEMAALAERVKANALQAIGEGVLDIVPGEGSLGRLFPEGEEGIVVAVYLSQEEMKAKRAGSGLAEMLRGGRPQRRKSKRWR